MVTFMNSSTKAPPAPPLLWPRFAIFPALAVIGHLALIAYWWELSILWRAAGIVTISFAWFCIAGCFHELAHLSLFSDQKVCKWLGRFCGMVPVIPLTLFRATHLTHHAAMNSEKDYELWPYSDPNRSLAFRRIFAVLDIFLGMITAPIIYGRIFYSRDSAMTWRDRRAALLEYAASAAFWGSIFGTVWWLVAIGRVEASQLSWWWMSPFAFAPMINTCRKMTEHVGLGSLDPMLGTRSVKANNPITRLISYFNFDISIHGPHHRHGTAKYHELPDKLQECLERQPEARELVFGSYAGVFWHTLKCMIKNPGVGVVVNPDAKFSAKHQSALRELSTH